MRTKLLLFFICVLLNEACGFTDKPPYSAINLQQIKLATHALEVRRSSPLSADSASQVVPHSSSKSTLSSSIINLTKNAVGAGVFSLSAKLLTVAPLWDRNLIPAALALICAVGTWAAYSFYTVAEVARLTGETSYADCWSAVVSQNSRWIVQATLTIAPLIGCLANTIVLTDLLSGLLHTADVPASIYGNRGAVAALLCTFILYPICSLASLSALQSASFLGLIGQFIAMGVVAVRMLDKSYLPGGQYATVRSVVDTVESTITASQSSTLVRWLAFASLVCYCNVTHYNAPKYFSELEDNTRARTTTLIGASYLSAVLIAALSMCLGIAAFGGSMKPYLLSNLSPRDPLAAVARLSIGASILASTPLMFMNVRNWLVFQAKSHLPVLGDTRRMAATLVFAMGALATRLTDVGKLGSIIGSVFGVNTMFTFPAIMYVSALRKQTQQGKTRANKVTVAINVALAAMGALLSVAATWISVSMLFIK